MFEEGVGGEGCDVIYVQNNALSLRREATAGVLAESRRESFTSGSQEGRCVAPSTQMTSSDDVRGSYAWDYFLSWEPKFQHLASVFNDIARLKDEHMQVPGIPKDTSFVFPPPLITAVAQPGIKAVPPRMPAITLGQVLPKFPRSPLPYHGGSLPEVMTPNFSPSLSLLTMQTPARSPMLPDGESRGTHMLGPWHDRKAEDEVQG